MIISFSCKREVEINPKYLNSFNKVKDFDKKSLEMKEWFLKDFKQDCIPGISIEKAYGTVLKNKVSSECTIAIIDMAIDIDHEYLKKIIWNNKDEIPNNGIDDDKNGYIDDINGWNFIGNSKLENIKFSNYEYTRIIRKYQDKFKDNTQKENSKEYELYLRALDFYEEREKFALKEKGYIDRVEKKYNESIEVISKFLPENLNFSRLEALKKQNSENKDLISSIDYILENKITREWINDYKLKTYERINKLLNINFNERIILNENSNDLKDSIYGNFFVNNNLKLFTHGTKVAGCISSILKSNVVQNKVKIMPIVISSFGDEHDKDIALAIRYAVNNGAKVINMSFGKQFSMNPEWLIDALKYAEKNNVLIIKSAGNNNSKEERNYPDDSIDGQNILVDNFIRVGSSSFYLNEKFKSSFSNYGQGEVDVFAPGEKIYTSIPIDNKYTFISGTSASTAITSAVAGLVYSYYPHLSASQVKDLIINSGEEYDLEVDVSEKGDLFKKTIPFKEISKSGKVLNAFNIFLMANNIY